MLRKFYAVMAMISLLGGYFYGYASVVLPVIAKAEKVTICHATSSESNPFVRIVVASQATAGHFDNNGTPEAGHEDDLLFEGEVACPGNEVVSPTVTPTIGATPTDIPSDECSATNVTAELVAEGENMFTVRFENTGDCDIEVGASSYEVPVNGGALCLYPHLSCQARFSYKDITVPAGQSVTVDVDKPDVCYQLDWYVGTSIPEFGEPAPCYSCEQRLLGYRVNASLEECDGGSTIPTPTPTEGDQPDVTPTPTSGDQPDVTPTPTTGTEVTPTPTPSSSGPTPTPGSSTNGTDSNDSGSSDSNSTSNNNNSSGDVQGFTTSQGDTVLGVTSYAETGVSQQVILNLIQAVSLFMIGVGFVNYLLTHDQRVY